MTRKDMFVVLVAVSMLAGFLTGLLIWNTFRGDEIFVTEDVVEVVVPTLPNPKVSTTLPPTPTKIPDPTKAPRLYARLSHYWPAWGPPNCHSATWIAGECTSQLSDGKAWRHWSWYATKMNATACPREFPLGTVFIIPAFNNREYTCVDRGGAINFLPDERNSFFLDLLTSEQPYVHGGEVVRDKYSPAGSYLVEVFIRN